MFLRRCAFIAFWAVLGLFLVRRPEQAAHAVRALIGGLALVADALARFTTAF
ncbi:hypothetical protein [Actinomadura sp. 6K520]|uniref:hypothetical protein n=1 Tax=Actinomadura sp. 6K520 TaxID=2530364 RepID=UPI0014052CE2|nr:hypothetical protein [Actinomadura sp. 6K520]